MNPVDRDIANRHAALAAAERHGLEQWRLLAARAQLRTQRAGDVALAIASAMYVRGACHEALPYAEHAVSIAREQLGPTDDPALHAAYWNVMILGSLGRTADAILLLEEAITQAYDTKTSGEPPKRLADLEELLGDTYCARGLFGRARRLMERALAGQRRTRGAHSAEYLQLLVRLASGVDMAGGDYASARTRLAEAEAIISAGAGTLWAESARHHTLMLRGHLARIEGRFAPALEAFQAALGVANRFGVRLDGRVISATIQSAAVLIALDRHAEAISLLDAFTRSVPLAELRAGDAANVLLLFVRASVHVDNDAPLPELLYEAVLAMAVEARSEFASADEGRRLWLAENFWAALREFLVIALSHFRHLLDTNTITAIYELVIDFKGIVADAQCVSRERRFACLYPEAAADLEQLAALRRTLQVTYGGTFQGGAPESAQEAAASRLRFQKAALERALRPRIPDIDSFDSLVSVAEVANALIVDATPTLLVEFVRINYPDSDAESGFAVFLLPQGRADLVRTLRLERLSEIRREVARFRQALLGEVDPAVPATDAPDYGRVFQLVWQPIADAISQYVSSDGVEVARLLIAPDDVLATLPFQVLRDPAWPAGEHLVDHYEISYLTSARDVTRAAGSTRGGPPLAIGLGQFGGENDTGADEEPCAGQARAAFRPLRHAEDEARFVASRLAGEAWTGRDAVTKLPLLRRLGHLEVAREAGYRSPTVVHFATHGFSIRTDLKNESSLGAPVENPRATLRQSGLALAGASAWAGLVADGRMPESHDAVLDAVDVSGLDLRDTVLTVLSSCESGLGTVLAGEGVFGLQRAFLLAGTQGLTMALFPVGDGSTSVLMEAFYDALAGGASPAAALRAAQRRVRRKYPWAVCWGGVVTVGRSCILPPPFSP